MARISTSEPLQKTIEPQHPVEGTMTETKLKKKKVAELIMVLERKTGKSIHKKRKQEIIDALLNFSSSQSN